MSVCHSLQGILSESVCWDVLENELSHAKQRNERLMNIFRIAAERQVTGKYGGQVQSYDRSRDKLFPSYPTILPVRPRVYKSEAHRETVSLMQAVLNSATHFSNFLPPVAPEQALFIAAQEDLYIPRYNVSDVRQLWPGTVTSCQLRCWNYVCDLWTLGCCVQYVPGGHVSSTVLRQAKFR